MGTILILLNTTKSQPNTQTSLMPPPPTLAISSICKKLAPPGNNNSVSVEITFSKKFIFLFFSQSIYFYDEEIFSF